MYSLNFPHHFNVLFSVYYSHIISIDISMNEKTAQKKSLMSLFDIFASWNLAFYLKSTSKASYKPSFSKNKSTNKNEAAKVQGSPAIGKWRKSMSYWPPLIKISTAYRCHKRATKHFLKLDTALAWAQKHLWICGF